MRRCTAQSLVSILLVSILVFSVEGASAIGIAMTKGDFFIDGNPVVGNATLFEGNTLETAVAFSQLQLHGGVTMLLGTESRGKVYHDRLVLEKGLGELQIHPSYQVEARGFRVSSQAPEAVARVALTGEDGIEVAALSGVFRVATTTGRMLAVIQPGMALSFVPQVPSGRASFTMTGCLEKRDGYYVLRDLVAGVIEEVRGAGLEREVGNVIKVTAFDLPNVKPATGAEEVIQIEEMNRVRRGCPAPPPSAPKAAKPPSPGQPAPPPPQPAPQPPTSQGGGMSGATKAVIAGVIIGGAGAGAAVYLTQREKSTISR
jgi:hypothetical protein